MSQPAKLRRRQGRQCFAAWCQGPGPHALDLDPELVGWICLTMAAPECMGITNLGDLSDALQLRRTFLRFGDDALRWNRLTLTAKTLWWAWRAGGS